MKSLISNHILYLLLALGTNSVVFGQLAYSIKTNYSIKQISDNGTTALMAGEIYYNKAARYLETRQTFPIAQTIITTDTSNVTISANERKRESPNPSFIDFSIFQLALSNDLNDFGLHSTTYKLTDTKLVNELTVLTYKSTNKIATGDILLSRKKGKLYGLAFFDTKGKLVARQFFTRYIQIGGIWFPCAVSSYTYSGKNTIQSMTTYSNVQINPTP